jgi:hypothetical protein
MLQFRLKIKIILQYYIKLIKSMKLEKCFRTENVKKLFYYFS